jgi:hypothetical protein
MRWFLAVIVTVMLGSFWLTVRIETDKSRFMAKCIETHTGQRCEDLYRYGRVDLVQVR